MGMMDYLIGKNVGRTEGKNSGASQADVDSAYAGAAETGALFWQVVRQRDELQAENVLLKKRFYRERKERRMWQGAAEVRKLSLMKKNNMTPDEVYDEQAAIRSQPGMMDHIIEFVNKEDAEIDNEVLGAAENANAANSSLSMT